jgi:hypothetical protein
MRRAESMQEVVRRNEFKLSTRTKKGLQSSSSFPTDSSSSYAMSKIHDVRTLPDLKHSSSSASSSSSSGGGIYTYQANRQVTPWFLQSTTFYRSQSHLNKLRRQQSFQEGSLHSSFQSMQSLHISDGPIHLRQAVGSSSVSLRSLDLEDSSEPNDILAVENEKEKKKLKKSFKKVFQVINIPKKIKQHQAEKNRFNIYTIPSETREQLKQIYVY